MIKHSVAALFAVALLLAGPAQAGDDDLGALLYANHCAACHGREGEGDGPVAATLRITTPNLRNLTERNGGVFPRDAVTAYVDGREIKAVHGDRQMPIWGEAFRGPERATGERTTRRRITAVVQFIALIQYR